MSPRDLSTSSETEKNVYAFVRGRCEQEPTIQKVFLFGSRARGDHHERSDFDLAIEAPGISDDEWAWLALELREKAPTLCGIDLVRLNQETAQDLSAKIRQEGIELYVRK